MLAHSTASRSGQDRLFSTLAVEQPPSQSLGSKWGWPAVEPPAAHVGPFVAEAQPSHPDSAPCAWATFTSQQPSVQFIKHTFTHSLKSYVYSGWAAM